MRLSKFNEAFSEPVFLYGDAHCLYAISQELYPTRVDAEREFRRFLEAPEDEALKIREDAVRYGYAANGDGVVQVCWCAGATGKGSKLIWILER